MRTLTWIAAAAATLIGGAAQAQSYSNYERGYLPPPPDAGYVWQSETKCKHHKGFRLLGGRAGLTVLGVNLDGSAGIDLSAGHHRDRCDHNETRREIVYAPHAYGPPPHPGYDRYGSDHHRW